MEASGINIGEDICKAYFILDNKEYQIEPKHTGISVYDVAYLVSGIKGLRSELKYFNQYEASPPVKSSLDRRLGVFRTNLSRRLLSRGRVCLLQ